MAIVVIDTNILMQDWLLCGAHITKVFLGCKRCALDIVIPDVVLDELIGNCKQEIVKAATEVRSVQKSIAKQGVSLSYEKLNIDEECKAYAKHVRNIFTKFDVLVEDYPTTSAKEIVAASYENKKPFKTSGEGYKDFLIFKTLISLVEQRKIDVHFLTNNHKDFCNAKGQLHPDLVAQVPDGHSVSVYGSAHSFYESYLSSELEQLGPLDDPEGIIAAIKGGTFPGFDLEGRLENLLIDELCGKSINLDEVGGPLNDADVTSLMAHSVDVVAVSPIEDQLLGIDLQGEVEVELFGFMDKSDAYGDHGPGPKGFFIDDGNWNDWVVSAYSTQIANFELSIVFDQDRHEIQSVSIELSAKDNQ